jgi:Uma2 family endonuclease
MKTRADVLPAAPRTMTEAEFDAWCNEDVWAEFKDGEVFMASPALVRHELVFNFLLTLLNLYVRRRNLGIVTGSQVQVRLRPGLRRVPDLLFVSQARMNIIHPNMVEGAPDLVVEIVSPDSVARDWRDKYIEYAEAGVREYWIIDPQAQRTEWYWLNEQQHYELIEPQDGAYHSGMLEGFYLRDEWLWQDPLPDPLTVLRELGIAL